LKIAKIDVIPIRAPRKEIPRAGAIASSITASEFGIIRIESDEEIAGLGEISITSPQIGFSLCYAARNLVAPRLIGLDPLQLPQMLATIDATLVDELSAPYLRAAFEMALLDLIGRYSRVSVSTLLGGKARESVPLAWSLYQGPPEEMAEKAVAGVAEGFHAIKLKVGRKLEDDIAAVRAVSTALDHKVPLRLDANMAWKSVADATRAIRAFAAEAPIAWIEQPLPKTNLAGLRTLRERCDVPIMADESLQTLHDAYEVARNEAADVWNVYVVEAGGLLAASHIFALANTLDVPCILGSQAELGIGTAACAHLGVSVPNLPHPCETFGPLRYTAEIVQNGPIIANGFLTPPPGDGLGVELDWEVVNEWRILL
jgi:muconate cycloisomerase